MQINNEIILDFIHCRYKAFLKSKHQKGILSECQMLYNQLKQTQKNNFEKKLSENIKLIFHNISFDSKISKEGVALDLNFKNVDIDITVDGIEFANNKIIPIFITPFENITKYDKQFISLQSYFLQYEFKIPIDNCKVIHGKLLAQSKFKLSSSIRSTKKLVDELRKILSKSDEPSLVLNNQCITCDYRVNCMEKAKADDNLSLLDRATTKVIEKYKKKGIYYSATFLSI
jgi:hypothetical protein